MDINLDCELALKSVLYANMMQTNKEKIIIIERLQTRKANHSVLCRICKQRKAHISIFKKYEGINIHEEIRKISGVIMLPHDKHSHCICQNCMDLLKGCILFREMCQKNNKIFIPKKKAIVVKEEKQDSEVHMEDDDFNVPLATISQEGRDKNKSSNFVCPGCNEHFTQKKSYEIHKLKCSSIISKKKRKFLCDTCGKTANSNAALLSHKIIHENVFPFKCDVCPYRGKSIGLLKLHQNTHLKVKPYRCPHCPTATSTSSNLRKHIMYRHSNARPYKCSICSKDFPIKTALNKHIKLIHVKETAECDICFKTYSNKKILQKHRYNVHKIKGMKPGRLPDYLLYQEGENNESNEPLLDKTS